MALSIAHLSFSSAGGAGTVASRLAEQQRAEGHQAWVHSLIPDSLWANPLQRPLHSLAAAIDNYVVKPHAYPSSVSLLRDRLGRELPERVRGADVVHIHWPNGLATLETLHDLTLSARVVWTLHDMNPFTATCHYAIGCRCYLPGDNPCQGIRRPFRAAAHAHLKEKVEFAHNNPSVSYASPSEWLAQQAMASMALKNRDVPVIPNPLPASLPPLKDVPAWSGKESLDAGVVFVASASELGDPLKNIDGVVRAFEQAFEHGSPARLLVVGRGSTTSTHPGVRFLGRLEQAELWSVLVAADYLVVGSLAENQPLAISEAQAMGVSLLAHNTTGLPEHLDIDSEGALFNDLAHLGELFREKSGQTRTAKSRNALARAARKKFDPARAVARYEELYLA